MTKVMDTDSLRLINDLAIKGEKNRALTDEFFEHVDPEGIHVEGFTMVHNDVEMRMMILAKMQNTLTPHEVWIDVDFDVYNMLRDIEDIQREYEESQERPIWER